VSTPTLMFRQVFPQYTTGCTSDHHKIWDSPSVSLTFKGYELVVADRPPSLPLLPKLARRADAVPNLPNGWRSEALHA